MANMKRNVKMSCFLSGNILMLTGYTPLCEAVWHKDLKLVQMLLSAGAKITQSHYLLHYAVLHRHYQVGNAFVCFLMQYVSVSSKIRLIPPRVSPRVAL